VQLLSSSYRINLDFLLQITSSWLMGHVGVGANICGIGNSTAPARQHKNWSRARISKRLWSPGIDSDGPIPPAYVAWRAGTSNRVVVQACHAGNRFQGSLKGLQIRAQSAEAGGVGDMYRGFKRGRMVGRQKLGMQFTVYAKIGTGQGCLCLVSTDSCSVCVCVLILY
jgi:hypothetical protein